MRLNLELLAGLLAISRLHANAEQAAWARKGDCSRAPRRARSIDQPLAQANQFACMCRQGELISHP